MAEALGPGPVRRWAVLGAGGFVGAGVVTAAREAGVQVVPVTAPRLTAEPAGSSPVDLLRAAQEPADALAGALAGCDVVVNAAGLATPGDPGSAAMTGANALLPGVVVLAAARAGARRVVHLSSAAVQGDRAVLDAGDDVDPRTPYARSKATGEAVVREAARRTGVTAVVARATSVQGEGRGTTRSLERFARSRVASVAGAGEDPVPVTSLAGLGRWVVDLATAPSPPAVSLQPWEGWTTAGLLRELGGREPVHLPVPLARLLVRAGYAASSLLGGRGRAAVRRVELVWFGQRQR
ncbi:NAD-dependent epimerase/dehydratase family protein [Aquipuribacter sp. MA13-6]|uniref:NAD-dependent epimerase/dehydratase family protein n=1 Tax=unclassified Aquipuribacter TaxID=2635084 RepID=UPI003EE95DC2